MFERKKGTVSFCIPICCKFHLGVSPEKFPQSENPPTDSTKSSALLGQETSESDLLRLIGGVALNAGDRIDWALQEDSSIWGFSTGVRPRLDSLGFSKGKRARVKVERKKYAGDYGDLLAAPPKKIQQWSYWDVQYLFFPLCQMKHVG